jgi:excisionase family DNA binding protein
MSDKKPIDPEGVYTISAAARLLSVSPSTLRDLERRGRIECTWTPGRQRRFGGADLLRFRAASRGATPREPAPTPPAGASNTGDAAAHRAWLGHLVARAQQELPVDTPAAIRLRVGTDLEHALGKWGPSSPLSDLEPLITSVVERAKHQVRTAQEESERREKKGELLDFGLRYLRRKLDGLSTRMVGARGSFNRRHIQATLRNQLRDQLQKQLRGDEDWDHVRGLGEDFVAAWVVAHPPASRIPTTVKVVAAGVTGLVGGATAAATLSPAIRAKVAKFKAPLLTIAGNLLNRISTPPPSAAPPTNPPDPTTTTPPPFRPRVGFGAGWPPAYRPRSWYSRPGTYKSPGVTPGRVTASGGQAPSAPPTHSEPSPLASPERPPTTMKTLATPRAANG